MILLGLKQIFKLATCSIHAALFVLKCPGNGMHVSSSWTVKMIIFNLTGDAPPLFCCSKGHLSNLNSWLFFVFFSHYKHVFQDLFLMVKGV